MRHVQGQASKKLKIWFKKRMKPESKKTNKSLPTLPFEFFNFFSVCFIANFKSI